jgi:hypothetical protein
MEIFRCANCIAPLRLDVGPVVTCAYCGAQTKLDEPQKVAAHGKTSGVRLAEAVAFATPARNIPFLEANAPLPIFRTETLSNSRDDQETLHVHFVQGSTTLTDFEFPITHRGPRGTLKIALTVRVAQSGAFSLTVAEPGTNNIMDKDAVPARVES